jgi:hypothetical protein
MSLVEAMCAKISDTNQVLLSLQARAAPRRFENVQMTIFIFLKRTPPNFYSGITAESSNCAHQDGSYEM